MKLTYLVQCALSCARGQTQTAKLSFQRCREISQEMNFHELKSGMGMFFFFKRNLSILSHYLVFNLSHG